MNKTYKYRPYFRFADIFTIALVLLTAASGFLVWGAKADSSKPETAYIRVNTKLVETIDLSKVKESYRLTIEGNFPVVLEVSCDGVRFLSSDCSDKLCVHSGTVSSGQSAACLPGGVSVSVEGDNTPVDAVVG